MWYRPNTFRRLSQNYSRCSRVLERVNYASLSSWGCLVFYSSRAWPLFLIGIPLGRILRDPFHIGIALRFTKTWRASHSLIHKNMVNKKSFTSAISIFNAFSLHTVSFRVPFSLYTIGFRIPSALSFIRPVVSLTFYHAVSHLEQWLTAHNDWRHITFRRLLFMTHIFCPYQYLYLKFVIW